ncbi:MAG: hypothetical protein AAB521_03535 [Patescibacteria group bacterium]
MDRNSKDYSLVITEVIKKQMIILGPDITLSRARNVKGLKVDDSGTVTEISGPPQELIQELIDQFVQLSGLIVQKTMEPILANYSQDGSASAAILKSVQAQIRPAQSPTPRKPEDKPMEETK